VENARRQIARLEIHRDGFRKLGRLKVRARFLDVATRMLEETANEPVSGVIISMLLIECGQIYLTLVENSWTYYKR
jgi:hypothetical protein